MVLTAALTLFIGIQLVEQRLVSNSSSAIESVYFYYRLCLTPFILYVKYQTINRSTIFRTLAIFKSPLSFIIIIQTTIILDNYQTIVRFIPPICQVYSIIVNIQGGPKVNTHTLGLIAPPWFTLLLCRWRTVPTCSRIRQNLKIRIIRTTPSQY